MSVSQRIRQTVRCSGGRQRGKKTGSTPAILEEFLVYEDTRGARKRHLAGLRSRVKKFLDWLEGRGLETGDIDLQTARNYQSDLIGERSAEGESYAVNTILSYRTCAASFCRFLEETGRIKTNPFPGVRLPRGEKKVLEGVLKESEMAQLLATLGQWEEAGGNLRLQMRAYLAHVVAELQYASGLRIAEVAALRLGDIDFEKRFITVHEGKHGRTRTAYLSEYASDVLSLFVTKMRPLILGAHHLHNAQLVFGSGYDRLGHTQNTQLARVAGALDLKITSHGFRHALGYHLLRSGCPLRQIQEILGHANIKDTEIYTKVDVSAIQVVLDECHPRGKRSLNLAHR